jgi:hypothetical protein
MPGQREFPQCGKMTAELEADWSQFALSHIELPNRGEVR